MRAGPRLFNAAPKHSFMGHSAIGGVSMLTRRELGQKKRRARRIVPCDSELSRSSKDPSISSVYHDERAIGR